MRSLLSAVAGPAAKAALAAAAITVPGVYNAVALAAGPGDGVTVSADRIVVRGVKLCDQRLVQTDELVFEAGSELRFSRKALEQGGGRVVIRARVIQCDPANPGRITWEKPVLPVARSFEKAAPGQSFDPTGNGDHATGHWGGNGVAGLGGDAGQRGADGPALELWALRIQGAGPVVNFRGQDGANGGPGQAGGDGGSAEKGNRASVGPFDCRSGAGKGGRGGDGGWGGNGGRGGDGGRGGILTVVGLESVLPVLVDKSRALIAGGAPGTGGPGGSGGARGEQGQGGNGAGIWCRDEHGRTHGPGNSGSDGSAGPTGAQGVEGIVVGIPITAEAFEARLNGAGKTLAPVK